MGELTMDEIQLERVLSLLGMAQQELLLAHKDMVLDDRILRRRLPQILNEKQASRFVAEIAWGRSFRESCQQRQLEMEQWQHENAFGRFVGLFADYEELQEEIVRQREHFDASSVGLPSTVGAAMEYIRHLPLEEWNEALRDLVNAGKQNTFPIAIWLTAATRALWQSQSQASRIPAVSRIPPSTRSAVASPSATTASQSSATLPVKQQTQQQEDTPRSANNVRVPTTPQKSQNQRQQQQQHHKQREKQEGDRAEAATAPRECERSGSGDSAWAHLHRRFIGVTEEVQEGAHRAWAWHDPRGARGRADEVSDGLWTAMELAHAVQAAGHAHGEDWYCWELPEALAMFARGLGAVARNLVPASASAAARRRTACPAGLVPAVTALAAGAARALFAVAADVVAASADIVPAPSPRDARAASRARAAARDALDAARDLASTVDGLVADADRRAGSPSHGGEEEEEAECRCPWPRPLMPVVPQPMPLRPLDDCDADPNEEELGRLARRFVLVNELLVDNACESAAALARTAPAATRPPCRCASVALDGHADADADACNGYSDSDGPRAQGQMDRGTAEAALREMARTHEHFLATADAHMRRQQQQERATATAVATKAATAMEARTTVAGTRAKSRWLGEAVAECAASMEVLYAALLPGVAAHAGDWQGLADVALWGARELQGIASHPLVLASATAAAPVAPGPAAPGSGLCAASGASQAAATLASVAASLASLASLASPLAPASLCLGLDSGLPLRSSSTAVAPCRS
eukprot:m51a1_g8521 hypothetical protein (763) ;mRNA; r:110093-113786